MHDSDNDRRDSEAQFGGRDLGDGGPDGKPVGWGAGAAAPQPGLPLDEDERLPWLESADDDDEFVAGRPGLGRVLLMGLLLALAVGAVFWYVSQRSGSSEMVADGGVIKAPATPYKEEPRDQGGKTFAGTGDSAFAVSEGKSAPAKLGATAAAAQIAVDANAPDSKATDGTVTGSKIAGGVGVQLGAYFSPATAEAGWARLSGSHEALKGLDHRIVEGSADIGTVFRLQAVASDLAAANALCARLKASGLACQVKR